MYLLDTNIFLEILLDQERSEICENLLHNIEGMKQDFYVSGFALHFIEVIMTKEDEKDELKKFLSDIRSLDIERLETSTSEEKKAVSKMDEEGLDFDDSIQYLLANRNDLSIVSYDSHFDKTKIERVEPSQVIQQLEKQGDNLTGAAN
jgi:predicted nucleic acid-binding protein